MTKEVAETFLDPVGESTLNAIADADQFNRWMYETIVPYTKGKILEIGSGLGNLSHFFLENKMDLTLSDLRPNYCSWLQEHFRDFPTLQKVEELDLVHPEFNQVYAHLLGQFDSVFALNVVEHIQDDQLALKNMHSLIKDQGSVIILVPAYQNLFNSFDKELGHFKRYTKTKLANVIEQKGLFKMYHVQYFNFVGIFPWFIMGSIFKQKLIKKSQMGFYNKLVPVFKIIDSLITQKMGLSVIGIGQKI